MLYIVATPIGNLKDITLRALEILKSVDLILCEDTRETRKLLDHYQIQTSTLSYHQHSKLKKVDHIIDLLKEGKNIALVSDAGTPGISDPGNQLIAQLATMQEQGNGGRAGHYFVEVVAVPGPSALTAAASVSGFPMDRFVFLGFPPAKRKRNKFFEEVANQNYPVIFYESPYRIIKTLKELSPFIDSDREIVVCRELTKKFETIYRGKIEEILNKITVKGEFVVIIKNK